MVQVMDESEHLFKKMSNGSILFKKNHGPMVYSDTEYFGSEIYDEDKKNIVSNQKNPVQVLGKFQGDWLDDLDTAISLAILEEYTYQRNHPDLLYTVNLNQHPGRMTKLEKMSEILGFESGAHCKIQMQRPGCVVRRHEDPIEIFKNEKGDTYIRVLITLSHWEYGQILCFNNTILSEWEPGTIFYVDYCNTQHFTANCSWHTRPILLITGKASDHLKHNIINANYKTFDI